MFIKSPRLLRAIFAAKGQLRAGVTPGKKLADGITIAPFKNNAPSAVSLSADIELSWAFRRHPQAFTRATAHQERQNIPRLLRIFEYYRFPITWATVGHLF